MNKQRIRSFSYLGGAILCVLMSLGASSDRPSTTVNPVKVAPSNIWTCQQSAVTATTQCQAAPGASTSLYVSDVFLYNGSTTASALQLVTGTGTNCGTGTANVTPPVSLLSNAAAGATLFMTFQNPLKVPANQALCCKTGGSTAFSCLVSGHSGP